MLSEELEATLNSLFQDAREKRHEYITVEHVLAALLDNASATRVLRACGSDIEELRGSLSAFIEESVHKFELGSEADTQPTLGFQRVIQRAVLYVQGDKRKEVAGADVLIAVFGEKDSHAALFLLKQNISVFDVVNFITHGISKVSVPSQKETLVTKDSKVGTHTSWGERSVLNQYLFTEPPLLFGKTSTEPPRIKLFISYSHADVICLERLLIHLRPLERSKAVACWSDKKIRPGDRWQKEIQKNINEAAIAILLVSADFLASDFIVENELPPLLVKAQAHEGTRILPVILKPCGFLRDEVLSSFQAINDPSTPLLALDPIEQESLYNRIADEVMQEIRLRYLNT